MGFDLKCMNGSVWLFVFLLHEIICYHAKFKTDVAIGDLLILFSGLSYAQILERLEKIKPESRSFELYAILRKDDRPFSK